MKVWITKYALTRGVYEEDAEPYGIDSIKVNNTNLWMGLIFTPDWHTTKEKAIKRAEEMRLKKIASLKKQIARIEAIDFKNGGQE